MRRFATFLLHLGTVGIVLGLSQFHGEYRGGYDFVETSRFGWALGYCAWFSAVLYGVGLPDVPRRPRSVLLAAVVAASLAALGVSIVQLVVGDALLPRWVVFGAAVLSIPWSLACAALSRLGRARLGARDRVLVVGGTALAAALSDELAERAERPATVVGSITSDDVVGSSSRLVEEVGRLEATVVVFEPDALLDERIVEQAAALHLDGVRIRTRQSFSEEWLGKIPVEDLARTALFFDVGELHFVAYSRFKRVADVVASIAAVGVLVVVAPFVALGDLVANRGPLLYRQTRVGRNGREFTIYKFRTMEPGAGAETSWTTADDPRVTRFGNFLRRSHIDELPQVVNVARGDLSFVGPRPEQPHYVAELTSKLPFYEFRHSVRPGITGWAQVKYGYAGDETDAREKLQYDFYYLSQQRLRFDLVILGRTVRTILGGGGR